MAGRADPTARGDWRLHISGRDEPAAQPQAQHRGAPDRRAAPEVLGSLPDATEATDRWLEKKVALQVRRILLELRTPRDREILTRFYLQDQDKDVICRDLSLDADQFDKVLHRARGRLKELIELRGLRKSDLFMLCIV